MTDEGPRMAPTKRNTWTFYKCKIAYSLIDDIKIINNLLINLRRPLDICIMCNLHRLPVVPVQLTNPIGLPDGLTILLPAPYQLQSQVSTKSTYTPSPSRSTVPKVIYTIGTIFNPLVIRVFWAAGWLLKFHVLFSISLA